MSLEASRLLAAAGQNVRLLAERIYPYHLKYEGAQDARAVFAYVYYNITLDLAERLENPEEGFENPEWVAGLAQSFADKYIAAMDTLDRCLQDSDPQSIGPAPESLFKTVPKPWADVYRAIRGRQSFVLEDLVFSMMAHISHDLPLALIEVGANPDHLADYHLMNEVLANRTEFIQQAVAKRYQRFLLWFDGLAGSYDEFFTDYGIRVSRSVAWYNAMRLLAPSSKEDARASIERSTLAFIESVRYPKEWWIR
ncbi:MAG: hypothetical protein GTO63_37145, partial [Anaerolineae bacterium]|nr:hypothetical protein [Anaerolineae bacterium]NIO00387.1 hypothetical protein [Anaerolineae bacterium]